MTRKISVSITACMSDDEAAAFYAKLRTLMIEYDLTVPRDGKRGFAWTYNEFS